MNPSTAQAHVVVDELARGGVRDVVLCPGSRNAPLAFALQAADQAGRIRLHMRIDERSAGFLAIGLAAASGRPVPVVMTSGYVRPEDRQSALQLGVRDLLLKPNTVQELGDVLHRLLSVT